MFRTRLISGIILVVLALVSILTGGWVLAGVLCAISVIAYRELTKATGVHTEEKSFNSLEITGSLLIVFYYVALAFCMLQTNSYDLSVVYPVITISIVMSFIIFMFVYVFSFPKYKAGQVMAAFFELIYAPILLSFIFMIREGWSYGVYLVWLVFFCSWGSDTFAYCVGVLFGKHKMAPKLSPKKSIEGAVGGVVGAAVLFGLYTYFVINPFTEEVFWIHWGSAMCLGAVGALVSMVGDLAASAVKRDHEIKDYGKLIPGHGGIMDRFDSVIIAAPLIFIGLALITP